MPIEIRRLLYSEVEVARAVSEFAIQNETTVPKGAVLDYKVESETPLKLRLHMQTREGKQIYHSIEEPFIAAALISQCMRNKIPIAKQSRKTVRSAKTGGIALDMTLEKK